MLLHVPTAWGIITAALRLEPRFDDCCVVAAAASAAYMCSFSVVNGDLDVEGSCSVTRVVTSSGNINLACSGRATVNSGAITQPLFIPLLNDCPRAGGLRINPNGKFSCVCMS
jgi:hypothetical protein